MVVSSALTKIGIMAGPSGAAGRDIPIAPPFAK